MPKGIKRTPQSIDEQIAAIQEKIVNYQSRITSLNAKKKSLLEAREKAQMDSLYRLVRESGKTPDQLIAELSQK